MLRLAYEPDDPCCRAIVGGSIPGRFPAFDFLRWIMRAAVCLCKLRTVAPLLTRSQLSPVRLGIAYTVTRYGQTPSTAPLQLELQRRLVRKQIKIRATFLLLAEVASNLCGDARQFGKVWARPRV